MSPGLRSATVAKDGAHNIGERRRAFGKATAALARLKIKASLQDDFDTGKLVITSLDAERLRSELGADAASVDFIVADDPSPPPLVDIQGGRGASVTKIGGGTGSCTTAFGVKDASTTGILTGAHCHLLAMNTAWAAGSVITQSATLAIKNAKWSTSSDFLWAASTGNAGTNKVWDGQFARAITSTQTAIPALGVSICKFGNVTGYSCQSVTARQKTWTNTDGSTVGPLVELTYDNPAGDIGHCGDSGGSVFYGAIAYGVMSRGDVNGTCLAGPNSGMRKSRM